MLYQRILNIALYAFNVANALTALVSIFVCAMVLTGLKTGAGYIMGFYTYGIYSIDQILKETGLFQRFTMTHAVIFLLIVSIFLLLTSIFGLIILIRPSKKSAYMHVAMIVANVILILSFAYPSLVVNHNIQTSLRHKLIQLQNSIEVLDDQLLNYHGELFMDIQATWQCCGVTGPTEWLTDVRWFRNKYSQFVQSINDGVAVYPGCTWYEATECVIYKEAPNINNEGQHEVIPIPVSTSDCIRAPIYTIYPRGCSETIKNEIGRCLNVFIGIVFSFAVFETLGLMGSMIYALRDFKRTSKYSNKNNNNNNNNNNEYHEQMMALPPFTTAHHIDFSTPECQAELAALCAAVIRNNTNKI